MCERTSSKTGIADYVVALASAKSAISTRLIASSARTRWRSFCAKLSSGRSTPLAIRRIRRFPCSRPFSSSAGTTLATRQWKKPCTTAFPSSGSAVLSWIAMKCPTPPRSVASGKASLSAMCKNARWIS